METNNINQIRNAIKDPKAMIYVIASEELKKKIISGSDPLINSMPKEASQLFLTLLAIVTALLKQITTLFKAFFCHKHQAQHRFTSSFLTALHLSNL